VQRTTSRSNSDGIPRFDTFAGTVSRARRQEVKFAVSTRSRTFPRLLDVSVGLFLLSCLLLPIVCLKYCLKLSFEPMSQSSFSHRYDQLYRGHLYTGVPTIPRSLEASIISSSFFQMLSDLAWLFWRMRCSNRRFSITRIDRDGFIWTAALYLVHPVPQSSGESLGSPGRFFMYSGERGSMGNGEGQ
jgi:hypothetical protein